MSKLLLVLVICCLSINVLGAKRDKGCRYVMGKCVEKCPEGTHAYASSCNKPAISERTCDKPVAKTLPPICDLSRCDCDKPTVRNKETGKCVKLNQCPKKHEKVASKF